MPSRRWFDRGTARDPGPHLDRLPVALDLRGISLAEGLRAAVGSGLLVLLSLSMHAPFLMIVAFAANLTCFCDVGGVLRDRVVALLVFTAVAAVSWSLFGLLLPFGWPVVVPLAGIAVFVCSMARVWGASAQAVGNVLIVVVALALDEPLSLQKAGAIFGGFVVGGLWAVLLTVVIWRIQPERPAQRAVGHAWHRLTLLGADLRRLSLDPTLPAAEWDAHARAHRRATRVAIEEARTVLAGVVRLQGPSAALVRPLVLRLNAAETVFAVLVALSDVAEAGDRRTRLATATMVRFARPLLAILRDLRFHRPERFEVALGRITDAAATASSLAPLAHALAGGIGTAIRADTSELPAARLPMRGSTEPPFLTRAWRPLRDNLTWRSAILRHAVRATVLTVPAFAWSLLSWSPYTHWLSITVALTMQPFFAATWQRVLERIGGTVLGGLIGAAVALLPQTPEVKAALLVPLCVIGFSVRQVSYGAYIACLTPLVVVLFDVAIPGHSDTTIAGMRLLYTVVGGLLALGACLVLWPTWEPDRLEQETRAALSAHAQFAHTVFATLLDQGTRAEAEMARRTAGIASNNLEASLSRSLQEPRRSALVEDGLVVDAALRRLGGAVIALEHEAGIATRHRQLLLDWQCWVAASLAVLERRGGAVAFPPSADGIGSLERLQRSIEVIGSVRGDAIDLYEVKTPPEAALRS